MTFKYSFRTSIFSYFHIFGKLILALRNLPAISYSIMGFSQLCKQAKAKYCVTMVEEEKAAGGKAKENYVASPFSTTWAVSLSCEVLQHTFHPRRSCNIFNTQTQAKQTDRLYSTEVKNGPSTTNLETYLYFGEQTKAAVIPLHCGGEIPNQKLNQSTNKLFDQVNDSFKKVNIFCTLFYPLMCFFFWKPVLLPKHCVVPMYCVYTLHGLNIVVFKAHDTAC